MEVATQMPLENPHQVQQWLQSAMPQYSYTVRGSYVVVGNGAATGVLIRPAGPGRAKLVWAFPSMGLQVALTLAIVLTGLLPGLIVFGIVWAATSGGVNDLRQMVAAALAGAIQPGAPLPPSAMVGAKPGGGLLVGGIFAVLFALGAFGFAANEFSDADRCDRWASERPSYGSSSYGLGPSFWSSRARTHREQGAASIGGGVFMLVMAGVMFAARSSKLRDYNARLANAQMAGMSAPGGFAPQPQGGFAQQMGGAPQQGFGQPQNNFGQPQNNFGQPQNNFGQPQNNFGQPSQQQGFGQPQQGFAPPQQSNAFGQPSQPNFGQAPQGFAQGPQQGFGQPPQQGFGQPQQPQGFAPPQQPQQGFGPPQPPQQGGWGPPNQGNGGGWPQQ